MRLDVTRDDQVYKASSGSWNHQVFRRSSIYNKSLPFLCFLWDYNLAMAQYLKFLCLAAVAVSFAQATGYGAGAGAGAGGFRGSGGYAGAPSVGVPAAARGGGYGGGSGAYGGAQNYPPQPYNFDYQAQDEQGNVHYRQEQGDQSGAVRGTYGYTDNQGLYRVVEYVADANGFRANVRTNEPGTGKEGPADVAWQAVDAPAGIQDRYTRAGGAGSYGGGYKPAASTAGAFAGGFQAAKPAGGSYGKSGY